MVWGGKEAVQKILQIDPDAKRIVSSGYAADQNLYEYVEYGFIGIVAKPYTCQNLLDVLNKVL